MTAQAVECKECKKEKPLTCFGRTDNLVDGVKVKVRKNICMRCQPTKLTKYRVCISCNDNIPIVDFSYIDTAKTDRKSMCRACEPPIEAKYKQCLSCNEIKPYNQYKEGKFEVCLPCRPQWTADYIKWAQETATHQNCRKCKIDKSFADFPPSKRRKYFPYETICRKCVLEASPNHLRHNVSREDFARMKEEQNYRCYICNRHEDEFINSKGSFQVDHNHQHCPGEKSCGDEKCVRRLLCARCNNGLGCYDDNISRMLTAIAYVNDFDLEPQKIDVSPEVREKLLAMLGLG